MGLSDGWYSEEVGHAYEPARNSVSRMVTVDRENFTVKIFSRSRSTTKIKHAKNKRRVYWHRLPVAIRATKKRLGGNKSHRKAIDTDSVAITWIRATKKLLTATHLPPSLRLQVTILSCKRMVDKSRTVRTTSVITWLRNGIWVSKHKTISKKYWFPV